MEPEHISGSDSMCDIVPTASEFRLVDRQPRSGYKVIFVPFIDGHPAGTPEDVLTGFVSAQGDALGRPVGVAVDRTGALLVADDVGNSVWRVTPAMAK